MGFWNNSDDHKDGSSTERFSDGTSVTKNSDGSVRESTSHETTLPFGLGGDPVTVTRDGDGSVTNVQDGWGPKG
jgi:hypothetical protein